jgi:hypothetical protein
MTKHIVVTLAIEAVALACLLTLALDMRAHNRVERLGGVNIWGYRGPVMQQKTANEIRIATVGGDGAFGWGVAASETLVYGVRQLVALALDVRGGPLRRFTAVNLGALGLEPAEYADWIRRFAYLRADVICIVPDARGHRTAGVSIQPDRHSVPFRAFGYAPILPLVVEEKGARLHSTPVRAFGSLAKALSRIGAADPAAIDVDQPASSYADAIRNAVQAALATGSAVVIVAPADPASGDDAGGDALAAMVTTVFAGNPRVRFVDLGQQPDMADPAIRLDGVALSAAGHATAASLVTPDVLDLVRRLTS